VKKKKTCGIQKKNIFAKKNMNALIVAIGDELLQGQTLNTNGFFLAKNLTNLSFEVEQIISIADSKSAITEILDNAIEKYNIVMITGGLGPTTDDITKKVLAEYFDGHLIENKEVLNDIKIFAVNRGITFINDLNQKQALVPSTCKVIRNPYGTAPGMLFEKNNTFLISMPGVPFEMEQMFTEKIIPIFNEIFTFPTSCIKFVNTFGIPESALALQLTEFENQLPENIHIAYLPSPEGIKLKLWSFGGHQHSLTKNIDEQIKKLKSIISENIFGYDDDTLEIVLARLLIEKKLTISTAESCTGGSIGKTLTSLAGSSKYFLGGIISYSNDAKINILKVKNETIENQGAVSEQTVIEMSKGALELLKTDISIAVSGIAGPDGATETKPVGTTCIAVAYKNNVFAKTYNFGTRRDINIRRATATALFQAIKFITNLNL
jgi:nicotinamide-nucleotide amidase